MTARAATRRGAPAQSLLCLAALGLGSMMLAPASWAQQMHASTCKLEIIGFDGDAHDPSSKPEHRLESDLGKALQDDGGGTSHTTLCEVAFISRELVNVGLQWKTMSIPNLVEWAHNNSIRYVIRGTMATGILPENTTLALDLIDFDKPQPMPDSIWDGSLSLAARDTQLRMIASKIASRLGKAHKASVLTHCFMSHAAQDEDIARKLPYKLREKLRETENLGDAYDVTLKPSVLLSSACVSCRDDDINSYDFVIQGDLLSRIGRDFMVNIWLYHQGDEPQLLLTTQLPVKEDRLACALAYEIAHRSPFWKPAKNSSLLNHRNKCPE